MTERIAIYHTCRCCEESDSTVKNRNPRRPVQTLGANAPVWMCEPCWIDPAILKADCKHGKVPA